MTQPQIFYQIKKSLSIYGKSTIYIYIYIYIFVQYNNFNSGEPNNSGSEHYGEIYVASGKWNDLKETYNFYSIVEYGGTSTDNLSNNVFFTRNLLISGAPSGTISGGNITVCSGTSTRLTHSGLTSPGSIVRWETSFDDFLTPIKMMKHEFYGFIRNV